MEHASHAGGQPEKDTDTCGGDILGASGGTSLSLLQPQRKQSPGPGQSQTLFHAKYGLSYGHHKTIRKLKSLSQSVPCGLGESSWQQQTVQSGSITR